jgi:eukaryotic-like serine/threonine-protein kinase
MLGNKIHTQYDITKFMGLGRFGETYLAKSKELPGHPQCVLKRYRPYQAEQPLALVKKSFEVQSELLYQLGQHDQIPRILAKVEDEDNLYLVQEYTEGQLLSAELIPEQPWNQAQVVGLLQDTLGILEFVHHQNFIHQDINPKNLIRRWRDGKFVLLGCSGVKDIAGIWKQPIEGSPVELIGTPGYISFEQEEGNPQFNTDIYALGIIAIQALTGTTEIDKDPETYQLSWQHLTSANLKLVAIIDRMVRPDYRNRYQIAREVSDDLRNFMQSQLQPSHWDNLRPHLIFGAAAAALFAGLAIPKFLPGEKIIPVASSINGNDPIIYQNKQIQINYPPQWQKEELPNSATGEVVTFWSPQEQSSLRPNLTVSIAPLSATQTSLAKYTEESIAELKKSLPNAKIIASQASKLADRPAHQIYYSGKPAGTAELQSLETWTTVNGKAYLLLYRAQPADYATYLPKALQSINSFKILNDQ